MVSAKRVAKSNDAPMGAKGIVQRRVCTLWACLAIAEFILRIVVRSASELVPPSRSHHSLRNGTFDATINI